MAGRGQMKTGLSGPLMAIALAGGIGASVPAKTPPADRPRTLLAVFAHPDDETLVGPLLASYARRGGRVRLAIVTDGGQGVRPHAGIPAGPQLATARAE